MEDVLTLYALLYDSGRPMIVMGEKSLQLLG